MHQYGIFSLSGLFSRYQNVTRNFLISTIEIHRVVKEIHLSHIALMHCVPCHSIDIFGFHSLQCAFFYWVYFFHRRITYFTTPLNNSQHTHKHYFNINNFICNIDTAIYRQISSLHISVTISPNAQ